MRRIDFLLLGAFFVVLCQSGAAGIAVAATITVKQLGGGDFTKINDAIFNAQQDDTIMVYPGRYEEAVVINKNLTLMGAGPQYATIYSNDNGISVNDNFSATIIGFTITGSKSGIYLGKNTRSIIRNNVIVSNALDGVYLYYNLQTTIANNTIYKNASHGIGCHDGSGITPLTIFNNIIADNGKYGIESLSATEYISYNNLIGNAAGNYHSCVAGTGDISQTPSFEDASSGNFVLTSTSTSKRAGRPGSADANPDGTRNDLGAFGGPNSAPFWPYPLGTPVVTNLTVTPTSVQKGSILTIKATGAVQ